MNNNSLEQTFTNTANAIRAKLHTQSGIAPENFAAEISKISGEATTNIYHVSTLDERNKLNAKRGNICLVHSIQETEISVNSVFNTFTFKDSFTIDTAIQNGVMASFRNNEGAMCDLSIEYYDNRLNIDAYAGIVGSYKGANISYTSQDGLTFNLEMAQGSLIDGNIVNLPASVSYEDMGKPIDQNIFKFGTIKELYFPGIYKYDGTNWNYLDIGISLNQPDLLKNKKGYTSNGTIVGSTDLNDYYLKNFKHYKELPESPEEGINYYIIDKVVVNDKNVYVTDCNFAGTTSYETIDFTRSPFTTDNDYLTNYNGYDYYISEEGSTIARREGNSLVVVYTGKYNSGVLHACVDNYVYMFSGSSYGIKYDLATGTTQNIRSHADFRYDSGRMISYNNSLICFRTNYMYTYSISSNSWSKKQVSKNFSYNTHYHELKVQDNYAYFLYSYEYIQKMDLDTGLFVNSVRLPEQCKVIAGSEYLESDNSMLIYRINDDLDVFQVCICNVGIDRTSFYKDGKIYSVKYSEDKADVITIDKDLNLNLKDLNLRNVHSLVVSVDSNNGITLPYKLVNEINIDKVTGIYYLISGFIYTKQVYMSDGTTFTKLFDYTNSD